ncbi:MAG: bifunctional UDP-3-O-[3-hydroxymyristoyl] N-acetylglucosamine deacetylase/3-hydroxyacyl-ACP dehydratase [Candidatus Latescibacterota bacterium]
MIRQQRTIAKEFHFEGVGLHTGNPARVTFKPAPANTGIKFIRVDLGSPVEIPANIDSIPHSSHPFRNTVLSQGDAQIYTVEHLLATCYGLHVDNLRIEINSNEPPEPPDGSCQAFARAFQEIGFINQGVPCDVLEIDRMIHYRDGDVELFAYPADMFKMSFSIQYDNKHIGNQYASFDVDPDIFIHELAPARTFVLMKDVEKLREAGLIKGGSLENAVVFKEDGILNETPLRFPDECVRHKILDLLGDLALIGVPVKGYIHAVKSGHAANQAFVRKLWEYKRGKQRLNNFIDKGQWDINLIQKIMPHRYPFLLVDRILEMEDKKRVVGIKNVTINEPFFAGHFPGHPIMPAVLIIEAMAQVGGVLLLSSVDNPEKHLVYFTHINNAKFRKPVLPGDQLRFELELLTFKRRICKMQGYAYVDGDLVAEAELLSTVIER